MHDFFIDIQKKYRLSCLKIIIVSTVIILGLAACGETKDAETLISEALEFQKKGDNNAAIIQLKNAVQQEPKNAQARFLLGTALLEKRDFLAAEKELNRALDLKMDPQKVLPTLTQVLFDLGKYQHLLDTLGEYSEVNSDEVMAVQGKTLMLLQKPQQAKAIFDRLLAKNPNDPEALIGLAQYALSEKDLPLAMQYADQAISKNPDSLVVWVFKANMLRAQNKPEEALAAFERVVQLSPKDANVYYNKAILEIEMGRFEEAESSIMRIRELAPNTIMHHYSQAMLEFNQEKHTEALSSIQKVLSAVPEHLPSVLLAGAIQLSLESYAQAEQYLEQYLKKNPNNINARKLMINTLIRSNQASKAIAHLKPALESSQQDPQLLAMAGEVSMLNGDFAKAAEFFEKANSLAPNNAALHTALGMTKLAMGDRLQGMAELELATDLDKNSSRAGILLAMAHFRSQDFNQALSVIEELEKEDPQNPLFQNLKGAAYLGLKDLAKAREYFSKAVAIKSDFFPAISNLARLDVHDQKPEAARQRLVEFLKTDDKHIQAMNTLSTLALSQGKTEEAIQWLERSMKKNPNDLDPALHLAGHYLRQGQKEKALQLSRKLYGAHSNEPRVLELLGQVQLAHDDRAAALESYEKLAAQLPNSAAAQLRIADINSQMKDYSATDTALKKALLIDPDYIDAKVAQARLAVLENKEDEAIAIAKKIQKDYPTLPVGHDLEGDLLMQQQKPKVALQAYEKAFSIQQSGGLMMKIHSALEFSGNKQKAHDRLTQWVANHPNDTTLRLYLANTYLSKQQTELALKEYEAILQTNPKNMTSLNNLAWLYFEKNDPRSLEYAQRAYQSAPNAPAVQDTLGWILAKHGKTDRALELLERAASQLPDNPTIQYHYADLLVKAGKRDNARKILFRITEFDTNFPEIEEAKALLQQVQ